MKQGYLLHLFILLLFAAGVNAKDPVMQKIVEIWHTERDLYNKSIAEYQEHTSIATAILVYGLANLDHKITREGYYVEKE